MALQDQIQLWGDKRYYGLKHFIRCNFGCKVWKIPLDAGLSCPNRDGTLGFDGCIFCSPAGSGDFAVSRGKSIREQISDGITTIKGKYAINHFIAYFQAFTNTYAPADELRRLYEQVLGFDEVVGIAIATRPDCLNSDVLELLQELNQRTYLWVELGLQTIHDKTAALIQRRYELPCFEEALENLKRLGIPVVCHTILGLPGETSAQMVETARYLSSRGISGIKLQLLHVLKGTRLAEMYHQREFDLMSREDYVNTLVDCLEVLSPDIVIHRLTGDGPKELLIGPLWSNDKIRILQDIERELKERKSWQGKHCECLTGR